ncbi:hypothetical protein LINPERHAP1_LOCUS26570 [Linum perenne]
MKLQSMSRWSLLSIPASHRRQLTSTGKLRLNCSNSKYLSFLLNPFIFPNPNLHTVILTSALLLLGGQISHSCPDQHTPNSSSSYFVFAAS